MKNKRTNKFTLFGLLLLAASLVLTVYNLETQRAAGVASQEILDALISEMPKDGSESPTFSDSAFSGLPDQIDYIPDYILNPNMDMPEMSADEGKYIAMLSIPDLGLKLPVNTKWNYRNLKSSPCRYSGSAYTDDLIICAHNYDIHFGSIKYLRVGDPVILTDMDGNVFHYEVAELEILDPYATEQLQSGNWDLTLFTCTVGGATRVTVRCKKL